MQGVSTKISAETVAIWAVAILAWVLFESDFGPGWIEWPSSVSVAVAGLLGAVIAYWVPEKAPNLVDS